MRSHIVDKVVWIGVNESAKQNSKLRSVKGGRSVIENSIERFCPTLHQSLALRLFLLELSLPGLGFRVDCNYSARMVNGAVRVCAYRTRGARAFAVLLIPLMWALDSGDVGRASERSDAGWFLQ
jgi:hypothetical protein